MWTTFFAIFEEEKSSSKFLEVLNHQHKNLEFSMEKSIGAFPFLDVQININENILKTRIWRKPTHTSVPSQLQCSVSWTVENRPYNMSIKKSKNNLFHRQYFLDRS